MSKNSTRLTLLASLLGSLFLAACGGDSYTDNNANAPVSPAATIAPTFVPTTAPTADPTSSPTVAPTAAPSVEPSVTVTPTPAGVASDLIDAVDLDANGGLAFNSVSPLNYLVGATAVSGSATAYTLSGESASGKQFIYGYNNNVQDVSGNTTSVKFDSALVIKTSTVVGALTVGKSSAAGNYADGGAVVLRLPSCSSLKLDTATTGDMYFRVEVSTDSGANWTVKKAPTTKIRSKGVSTEDLSSYVKSATPVWVRLTNGGTGGFNIQRMVIAP